LGTAKVVGRAIDLGDALSEAGADPAVDPIQPRNVAAVVEAIRAAFVRAGSGVLSRMLRTWLALGASR
jgi:hypothetical protein